MSLTPGSRIGAYEILASLGTGGMGDVYRAHDARLGRDVALKVLPAEVASDPDRLARFQREARAVAALNHPHIVTIFSIEEDEGRPFLTMELVEGRSLDQTLASGPTSLSRFFEIGTALADALAAAHRKQIVHRDVKPANVMVSDEGSIKILDFGLARAPEPARGDDAMTSLGLTQAGIILGTVPYMSPEQIEGKPVDHRSDIFSLGILLYEMAAGMRPFAGESSPALMSSILRDQPRPITAVRPDVPEGVWRLVAHCLEKSANERVQSARDVLIELKTLRREWESGASAATAPAMTRASNALLSADLRVAVLPFAFRGGPDAEALADGLTDDVTAGLSRFSHLRVVSRLDAEKAKGQSADAAAAKTVGARYLVDGTVRTAGTAVRLSVRLIDTFTSAHIWAENFDRTLGSDLFALQDDLADRIVATVGDSNGFLTRSLGTSLKDRPADELVVSELVMRFYGYAQQFRADEHQRLRGAFERALAREPNHALGWACLSILYEQEFSQSLNPLPDSLKRSLDAAQRSGELDPTCQTGWRALATIHFFERDLSGLRAAAERTRALNELNATTIAFVGLLLSYAGDWDRGVEMVQRAMDLNPHHPGWLHYVTATNHYRKGEFDQALVQAKRSNVSQLIWSPVTLAVVAGQLGLAADARAALDALRKNHPDYLASDNVRELWSKWQWDNVLVDHLMDGFDKAKALVEQPTAPVGMMRSGYLGGAMFGRDAGLPGSGGHASIAVMPFADLSAARDQEWFCDGIAEEILNALTPLKNLRVAARASAFSLRGKSEDLTTIGEKLNVTTVLTGSVRRAGDRVRITVQLSEVQSGSQLWSERYDRELKDIFDIQDEIARAVAERLRVSLADGPLDRLARLVEQGTTDIEAYQLYLKGRALLTRRGAGVRTALELFQQAIERDPKYSLAWAGVADAYTVLAYLGIVRGAELKAQAIDAAERSIALDASSAAAHTALACAVLLFDNNRSMAQVEFERALTLNPQYVQGRCWYALFYLQWARGELDEGLAQARRALADDPLSAYATMIVGASLFTAGRYDEAITMGRLAVERDPDSYVARWELGATLVHAGRLEEAIAMLTSATTLSANRLALNGLAYAYAQSGRLADAEAIHAEALQDAAATYVPNAFLALTADAAGHRDDAIAFARKAWDDREPPFILFARYFPEYATLRSDPRFQAILRKMEHEGHEGQEGR